MFVCSELCIFIARVNCSANVYRVVYFVNHVAPCPHPGLPSRTITRAVSSELLGFLVSSLFSFLVPCARLSWPFCQLFSARKYTILYHIVLHILPNKLTY